MSYVHKKIRVFREAGDIELHRKRSDGRMKTYTSATDARAWCDITEDRRQHILDLVRQGDGKGLSLGKYIPIEAIIDILLANKNRDIKRLQDENEGLRKLLRDHGISYEEKALAVVEPQTAWTSEDEGKAQRESKNAPPGAERADPRETRASTPRSATVDSKDATPVSRMADIDVNETSDSKTSGPKEATGDDTVETKRESRESRVQQRESRVSFAGRIVHDSTDDDETSKAESSPGAEENEISEIEFEAKESFESTSGHFITDSSDHDTDTSPRYGEDDKLAATVMLAGKSPEEQVRALKQALLESEAFYKTEHELALRAIEQLENIKDIVEGGEGDIHSTGFFFKKGRTRDKDSADSCKDEIEALEREIAYLKSSSSPEAEIIQREVQVLRKYCAQLAAIQKENADLKRERDMLKGGLMSTADAALREKFNKLDEVTKERDSLQARVQQLEQELLAYSNLPQQIDEFKERTLVLGDYQDDEQNLHERLHHLRGLENEVKRLRDKAVAVVEAAGDTNEKDELLAKIKELERENDQCKCNMKEIEILRVERNCLRMRVDDLSRIQQDYEDLLKKTQGFDALKAECAMYKNKYEELKKLEAECNDLRAKVERVEELENERRLLMKGIEDCECCMNNQENEIKRLSCHIDCLTEDLDKRQDEMKVKVLTMRAHIEKKDVLIANSEQKLADLQDQLRSSIEQLSCETTCLRNRIDELEDDVLNYQKALAVKDEDYKALEENLKLLEDNNKALLDSLQSEKNNTTRLEEALKKAIKSDDHLQQMLKHAKCAIKCITQKLEKQEFVGIGRLEAERESYLKKIQELSEGMTEQPCGEDRILELEEELMRANALNKTLKDELERMNSLEQENETLKKLATELQSSAKNQVTKLEDTTEILSRMAEQTEDTCDELRQQLLEKQQLINSLNQQLEAERKRNVDLVAGLESLSASGDLDAAEINKLRTQINILNAEIDRLNFDLENRRRECDETVSRLRTKIEQQEADAERIRKLQDENADVSTDADKYRKECELLKDELEKRKKECEDTITKLKTQIEQQEADAERIRKLQDENADVNTDVDRYKKESRLLQEEIDNLRNKLRHSNSENEKLKNEIEKLKGLEKEQGDMKDEMNKLKQELGAKDAAEKENKDLKDEINKLKQQLAAKEAIEKECDTLKNELNKAKENLFGKSDLEAENKSLKDTINKLEKELDALRKGAPMLSSLENDNKNLKEEIERLKKESQVKDDSKDFAKERDDLLNQITAQKKEITDLLNKIKEPSKFEDTLPLKELENRNRENQKLRDTIDSLEKQLKDLQRDQMDVPKGSPEIERVVNDLKNSLEKEEARTRDLEDSLKKCQDNNENMKQKISELEESLRKCQQNNEDLKNTIAQLESQQPITQEIITSDDPDQKVKDLEAELAKRKKECNDMIASLKEQYDRDIKNLQKQNEAAIDKLQKSHQDALNKLNQEHEGQMDKIKQELRTKERSLSKAMEAQKTKTDKKPSTKKETPKELADVVRKEPSEKEEASIKEDIKEPSTKEPSIKEEQPKQLSMRTFKDVCICGKLPMVIPIGPPTDEDKKSRTQVSPSPRSALPQPQDTYTPFAAPTIGMPQPMDAIQPRTALADPKEEKITSIKKIVELENRLLVKQEHTKQKINMLQSTVERCKRELELERQKNNDLISRYTNQSKTVANMKVEMDIVKRESFQDKRKLQQLNMTLQNIRSRFASVRTPAPGAAILTVQPVMPHFHTELFKEDKNAHKHTCILRKKSHSCPCNMGDISSDSFEIDE